MKRKNLTTRRAVVRGAVALGLAPLFGRSARATEAACEDLAKIAPIKARAERAVSLRQLSQTLAAGKSARLDGLTRLDGFIADKENRDIILWGLAERNQPELQVSDFVVALRSSHGRYIERRDGINYIVNPIISIDPDPAIFRQLNELERDADFRRAYTELCKSPQVVRVEGMPRNTRVAKVLIEADYRMKMVGQGTVKLPISSPFPSDTDTVFAKWREEANNGDSGRHVNTRYWFQAGRFAYQVSEEADTVFVDHAQVVLNDENQFLTKDGLVASGKVDPISRAFTCAWTDRMEDIYKAEQIWRDMHNIFRHFAIARILKDRGAFLQVNFAEEFLLDRYELPKIDVPATLPGLGRVEEYEHPRDRSKRTGTSSVCGGVSVGFNKPLQQNADTGQSKASSRDVLAARPTVATLAWSVTPGSLQGIFNHHAPKTPEPKSFPEPKKPSLKELFKS